MRNLNTPLATSLLIPLTLLPLKSAVMLWVALSYAMMLITVWLFSHILGLTWQKKPISLSLFLCAAGSFTPYYINLNLGQMGCLTLLMLTLFWRFSRQHPHSLLIKSIWIGLLTAIKPFFGLFALPLIKQQKKSIFWLMAATVFFSLFPLLWLGHHSIPSFLSSLLTAFHDQRTLTKLLSPLNGSIISTLCKLNPYILGSIHFNATFSYLLSLPIIWGLLRFLWQQLQPSLAKKTDHIDYYFSILTTSLMLINPVGWQYYCGFLMIPLVVAAKQYLKQPRPGLPIIFAVALFLINIAQPTQPKFLELLAHHPGLTYDLPIEHYLGLFLGQTLLLVTLVMGHQKPTSSAVQHKQPLSLSLRQQQLMMAVILGISPAILNMLHQVF